MDLKRFQSLKQQAEDAQRRIDKSTGILSQITSQLKEFDCTTLDQGDKQLTKLEKEETKLEQELATGMDSWEQQWLDKLEELT